MSYVADRGNDRATFSFCSLSVCEFDPERMTSSLASRCSAVTSGRRKDPFRGTLAKPARALRRNEATARSARVSLPPRILARVVRDFFFEYLQSQPERDHRQSIASTFGRIEV